MCRKATVLQTASQAAARRPVNWVRATRCGIIADCLCLSHRNTKKFLAARIFSGRPRLT